MRLPRIKLENGTFYYHCSSRITNREFIFGTKGEKALVAEKFVELMRKLEIFCGIQILTFSLMSNHFHILAKVPMRRVLDEAEILDRVEVLDGAKGRRWLEKRLERLRRANPEDPQIEKIKAEYLARMFDVSNFMKELKGTFAQWYNNSRKRTGPLWSQRFHSVLIEGDSQMLMMVAAYIDLNPMRAGLVEDPKDYRYCGYGEAVAGNQHTAQEGLAAIVEGGQWTQVQKTYRNLLFAAGKPRSTAASSSSSAGRRAFSPEQVERNAEAGGALSLPELLGTRLRFFSNGLILGQRKFVEENFQRIRARLGPRADGAKPVPDDPGGGMHVLRYCGGGAT